MPIEEKDNRQQIKLTIQQIRDMIGHGDVDDVLLNALAQADEDCVAENKAQEILIVIDKGF